VQPLGAGADDLADDGAVLAVNAATLSQSGGALQPGDPKGQADNRLNAPGNSCGFQRRNLLSQVGKYLSHKNKTY